MAKKTFTDMKKLLTYLSIGMQTRIRMLKCFVWSVSLYGLYVGGKNEEKNCSYWDWFFRRMLKIPWTARVTNEKVLEMAGVPREMLAVIRVRQLGFLGHILRHEGLEKDALLERIKGWRARESVEGCKWRWQCCEACENSSGSRRMAFHGRPRQWRHGTSVW